MFYQDNSEEDTEGDESYVSADAEEASEEVVPEDVESNDNKDLEETKKDALVNEVVDDVEEVSEEAGEALVGSEREEGETELAIAAVDSATDKSVETVENEEEPLDEVGSSEENEEAMEVEHAAQEEEEEGEAENEDAARKEKSSSPKKVHFSDQVCFK